jgi:hypothetical protein
MATNEDLAIAFLCLCDTKDREHLLEMIEYTFRNWDDQENKDRIREALRLPTSLIQRKIALLHTGLYTCPQRKQIYEEMANRLGNLTTSLRSPLLKPRSDKTSIHEAREHIMPISLYSKQTSEK